MDFKEVETAAREWTCPMSGDASTPYEIDLVKNLTAFGVSLVVRLHKERNALAAKVEAAEAVVAAVREEHAEHRRVHYDACLTCAALDKLK